VIGGEVRERSTHLVRSVRARETIARPTDDPPQRPSRDRLRRRGRQPDEVWVRPTEIVCLARRVRSGELRPQLGGVRSLAEAPAAFASTTPPMARTIVRI
jgi:hypothetical protein